MTAKGPAHRSVVMRLAAADALASLGRDRRGAMWEALAQHKPKRSLPLLDGLDTEDDAPVELPTMELHDQVVACPSSPSSTPGR